ncbi:hypothetical protein BKA62DRAFT_696997 [Auriculariales sp. MPI-PUGE-AT-0066]|nr:hypothetical protein BKA62DRAFT_696997 [Auriculariales sp. MPI-PUGE-AT-0066]
MPLPKALAPIFLLVASLAWSVLHGPAASTGVSLLKPGCATAENPYRISYSAWPKINGLLCVLNTFFATILAQPVGKAVAEHFLLGVGPLLVLVPTLESSRWYGFPYALLLSVPNVSSLLSQVLGAGFVLPVYFLVFVLAVQPTSKTRPVQPMDAERALVQLVLGYLIPSRNILVGQSPRALAIFQIFPVVCIGVGATYNLVRKTFPPQAGEASARASFRNVSIAYAICAATSAWAHFRVLLPHLRAGSVALSTLLVPQHSRPFRGPTDVAPTLAAAVIDFLKWDYLLCVGSLAFASLFVMEEFIDVVALLGLTAAAGPGAGLAAVYYLREKRIVDAQTKAVSAGKKSN